MISDLEIDWHMGVIELPDPPEDDIPEAHNGNVAPNWAEIY